jgi:hypothetical protein
MHAKCRHPTVILLQVDMETAARDATQTSHTKAALRFLFHQVIGTWGVALLASFLASSILDIFRLLNRPYPLNLLHRVFAYTPYFPIQVGLGCYFGWLLSRRLGHHRLMVWVWIIPGLVLCYAVATRVIAEPAFASAIFRSTAIQSSVSHYFGWDCRPKDRCFDQTLVTMPFYISVAYSLGAFLGRTHRPIGHS